DPPLLRLPRQPRGSQLVQRLAVRHPSLIATLLILILLSLSLAAAGPSVALAQSADRIDLRLRVTWGGGANRAWQGEVRLTEGRVAEVVNLGREADDPGSLDVGEASVQIVQPGSSGFAGLDVSIDAPRNAELIIELAPRDRPTDVRRMVAKLTDLITRPQTLELDDQQNRLHVQRAPGDRLRVKFDRDHLVFAPRDEFHVEVHPNELALDAGVSLRCRVALLPARGDEELWKQELDLRTTEGGRLAPIGPLRIPVPENDGAYEVQISLSSRRLANNLSLSRPKPLFQRSLQFVVISPTAPAPDQTPWRTLAEIDPALTHFNDESANSRWTDWLKRMPSLKSSSGFSKGPLGNNRASRRDHAGRSLVSLAPQGWVAYPLPVGRVDEPHVLEVEYPSDLRQTLGISIVEPNAAGRVVPLGVDSGIDVLEPEPGSSLKWQRHRLVFWPRTKTPLVLLTNRRDDGTAVFGKLAVQAGPARLPPVAFAPNGNAANNSSGASGGNGTNNANGPNGASGNPANGNGSGGVNGAGGNSASSGDNSTFDATRTDRRWLAAFHDRPM
ncbi:MAG TPA: hypothetical protein PLV92_21025, partial [Pirellulaceae bacterium]|nr:hypothetical protein [Pirellulaceae bacterium]